MPRNTSDAGEANIKRILYIRHYRKTKNKVKTGNHYLERNSVQQAEVVGCQVSGEVEVWHWGECRFKF